MKALSTAWQSRLQSSAFTNLSEAGQLFSFPAALTLPFGKCPFAISAFCPPWLAGFAIKTRLRKLELFSIRHCLLRPFSISSEEAPGQGLSALFSSLALLAVLCSPAWDWSPGTARAELSPCCPRPGSVAVWGVLGHTGLYTASWAV